MPSVAAAGEHVLNDVQWSGGGGADHRAGRAAAGWPAVLVEQPAAWTVPLAFLVMAVVSLRTARRVPGDVGATMLRLHAPDSVRLWNF